MVANVNRMADVPAAPNTGKMPLAMVAPNWMDAIAITSKKIERIMPHLTSENLFTPVNYRNLEIDGATLGSCEVGNSFVKMPQATHPGVPMRFILTSLFLLSSLAAQASHRREFTQNEMDLTNTLFKLCPQELTKLMTRPFTNITKASLVGNRAMEGVSTIYSIQATTIYPMPSGHTEKHSLTIREVKRKVETRAADHPGYETDVDCSLQESL